MLAAVLGCGEGDPTGAGGSAAFTFPSDSGKLWQYADTTSSTVCSAGTCTTSRFEGRRVLLSEGPSAFQGRSAFQLAQFRFDRQGLAAVPAPVYLTQDQTGLEVWKDGTWGRIVLREGGSFANAAFLLSDGDSYGAPITMGTGGVTVPAGTYAVIRSVLHYRDTGPLNPVDVLVDRHESFADGVGLIEGGYSLSIDDKSPMNLDRSATGRFLLETRDAGVGWTLLDETEPNDGLTATGAQPVARVRLIHGDAAITDAATVPIIDPMSVLTVSPDTSGVSRLEDMYRITQTPLSLLAVDLVVEQADQDADIYLLTPSPGGFLVLAAGQGPAGQTEHVLLPTDGQTYYIAVQAWNVPAGGRVRYWLCIQ